MKGKKPLRPNVNNDVDVTSTNSNGKEMEKITKKETSGISNPFGKKLENSDSKEPKDEIKRNVVNNEINNEKSFDKQNIDDAYERKKSFKEFKDDDPQVEKIVKKKGNEYTFSETSQSHSKF